jgi:cytochrome c oxidase subunit 1
MIVTTFPWHWVGILGMPRRMAYFDYSSPALSGDVISVAVSAFGGFILLASGLLFLAILIRAQWGHEVESEPYRFATAVHPPVAVPAALNGFTLWIALMIGLTITNYGYPIAELALRPDVAVPAVYIGAQR